MSITGLGRSSKNSNEKSEVWVNTATGKPATSEQESINRSGLVGINEPNPESDYDIKKSVKAESHYTNGLVSMANFGGQKIGSELGYSILDAIKGQFLYVIPAPGTQEATDGMISAFLQADLGGIGSVRLISSIGFQNPANTRYAKIESARSVSNGLAYFSGISIKNSQGKLLQFRGYDYGFGSGYELLPMLFSKIQGDGTDQATIIGNAYTLHLGFNVFGLSSYGSGAKTVGVGAGDTTAKTGTPETILGSPTTTPLFDINGNLLEVKLNYATLAEVPTGSKGMSTSIDDCTLSFTGANIGSVAVGGGANYAKINHNGTNWIIG
jgi:hypothetical protein